MIEQSRGAICLQSLQSGNADGEDSARSSRERGGGETAAVCCVWPSCGQLPLPEHKMSGSLNDVCTVRVLNYHTVQLRAIPGPAQVHVQNKGKKNRGHRPRDPTWVSTADLKPVLTTGRGAATIVTTFPAQITSSQN